MNAALSRRRVQRILGMVAAGIVVIAAWFWLGFLPDWRPALRRGEVYGVDVSHYQGVIQWERVSRDGIDFAYIKATEGGDLADNRFARNWQDAHRAGIKRGAYHFFTLCRPGAEQARWFLSVARPDPNALPPTVDLEIVGNCAQRPDSGKVARELDVFLGLLEAAWDRDAVLYVGDDFERVYPTRERLSRPLWLHRIGIRPNHDRMVIWQVHGFAHVDGIAADADLNVGRL